MGKLTGVFTVLAAALAVFRVVTNAAPAVNANPSRRVSIASSGGRRPISDLLSLLRRQHLLRRRLHHRSQLRRTKRLHSPFIPNWAVHRIAHHRHTADPRDQPFHRLGWEFLTVLRSRGARNALV